MDKTSKMDRRVKYTKMVIKESFIKLLHEKPITKITIREICDLSDVNRTTFYAHYHDQYDLLRQLQNELMTEIVSYLNQHTTDRAGTVSAETLEEIFSYIKEKAEICSLFLSDNVDTNFENQVIKLFHEWCISTWASKRLNSKLDMEYIYTFSAYGCIGVIKKWLDEGMVKPTGEMADFIIKMTSQGLGSLSQQSIFHT
ncbi:MAG: TetR-like C-terminal domain-containing protein [Eubacteriales bacterium]|nr:TetR-like C-terminal domain-containing protein [Eubacteriales bacterium]